MSESQDFEKTDEIIINGIQKEMEKEKTKKKYIYSSDVIKRYNDTFKQRHALEVIKCPICFQSYNYSTKYYHNNSKTHQIALKLLNQLVSS